MWVFPGLTRHVPLLLLLFLLYLGHRSLRPTTTAVLNKLVPTMSSLPRKPLRLLLPRERAAVLFKLSREYEAMNSNMFVSRKKGGRSNQKFCRLRWKYYHKKGFVVVSTGGSIVWSISKRRFHAVVSTGKSIVLFGITRQLSKKLIYVQLTVKTRYHCYFLA